MVDYLLHFYRKGSRPFRSLSALPEDEACALMRGMYVEGAVFWERFKDPAGYLSFRKRIESQLRDDFVRKGGRPRQEYPIYLVLGRPKWTQDVADAKTTATTAEIRVPLSILTAEEVSFTYPDSMVSALMAAEKNSEYYEPDFHGKVFTLSEITRIIEQKGLPGEGWQTKMPRHLAHYIEAQAWNQEALFGYLEQCGDGTGP